MEIIKTKTVFVSGFNLDKQNDVNKLADILKQHAKGFWNLYKTNKENELECILTPLSNDIEAKGYNWKEYQVFEHNYYGARLHASMPVGFKYKG